MHLGPSRASMCVAVHMSLASAALLHLSCFFFNDTATTEIYTLSLHDALPIFSARRFSSCGVARIIRMAGTSSHAARRRSEEHTSELQSPDPLVCRILLEKQKGPRMSTCPPRVKENRYPTRTECSPIQ